MQRSVSSKPFNKWWPMKSGAQHARGALQACRSAGDLYEPYRPTWILPAKRRPPNTCPLPWPHLNIGPTTTTQSALPAPDFSYTPHLQQHRRRRLSAWSPWPGSHTLQRMPGPEPWWCWTCRSSAPRRPGSAMTCMQHEPVTALQLCGDACWPGQGCTGCRTALLDLACRGERCQVAIMMRGASHARSRLGYAHAGHFARGLGMCSIAAGPCT